MGQDTQAVKFRLIGAAVVVVVAVLAWWLLLSHDVRRYQETRESIPQPIHVERFDVQEPEAVPAKQQIVAETVKKQEQEKPAVKPAVQAKPASKEPQEKVSKVSSKPATASSKPEPMVKHDEHGLPIAYVVQAGSFSQKDNANQLKGRLLEKNLPAYVKQFNLPQGPVFRVLIGPKLSKSRAEEIIPYLKLSFNLDGQVLRYKPGFEE